MRRMLEETVCHKIIILFVRVQMYLIRYFQCVFKCIDYQIIPLVKSLS